MSDKPVSPTRGVMVDIEGTTTPIAFVRDTLFPFARARLPSFLAECGHKPPVAAELAEVRRLHPGADPLETLNGWMDADAKVTPLKALQGMIWDEGYRSGELRGAVYPDVPPALRAWHAAGLKLFVYSSGSVAAQRQIFGHSTAGDLAGLFADFFDTRIGAKRERDSYDRIAIATGNPATFLLFLSDVGAELDAAAAAGLRTCQLVRPEDGTVAVDGHPIARDFNNVAALFGLPSALT